jgi:hypothetical protein
MNVIELSFKNIFRITVVNRWFQSNEACADMINKLIDTDDQICFICIYSVTRKSSPPVPFSSEFILSVHSIGFTFEH